MTPADKLIALAKLNKHANVLMAYRESQDLSVDQLKDIVQICNSANEIIGELQAGIDTEKLMEKLRSKT